MWDGRRPRPQCACQPLSRQPRPPRRWLYEQNQGEWYSSCWDAVISDSGEAEQAGEGAHGRGGPHCVSRPPPSCTESCKMHMPACMPVGPTRCRCVLGHGLNPASCASLGAQWLQGMLSRPRHPRCPPPTPALLAARAWGPLPAGRQSRCSRHGGLQHDSVHGAGAAASHFPCHRCELSCLRSINSARWPACALPPDHKLHRHYRRSPPTCPPAPTACRAHSAARTAPVGRPSRTPPMVQPPMGLPAALAQRPRWRATERWRGRSCRAYMITPATVSASVRWLV